MSHHRANRSTFLVLAVAGFLLVACNGPARTTAPTRTATAAPLQPTVSRIAAAPPSEPGPSPTAAPAGVDSTPAPLATAKSAPPLPLSATLSLLGQASLGGQGFNADVYGHNGFAYIGSWGYAGGCPATGVRIVDLADPTQPRLVGAVAAIPGTTQEKLVVRHITTAGFTGELLAVGIQRCDRPGQGGVSLYDVSDPYNAVHLGFSATGPARGVHELDLIQQGDRALALLAVPSSESNNGGDGDFRIVDVSDPRHPVQLSQWGVHAALGVDLTDGTGCHRATFDHSARASADGRRVYLSYWDAGVVVLDIADPASPRLLGQLQYPPDEEGETHSVAEAGGHYLLVADENGIFGSPPALHFRVQTAAGPREIYGCEAHFSRPLVETGLINADLVAAGDGCPGGRLPASVDGKVALVEQGGCSVEQKAARLQAAGARALIAPAAGDPIALTGGKEQPIPVVGIREQDAADLRRALAGGTLPVTLPAEKHSGGLRIWDIADLANARQVAVYQTPDSVVFPPPSDGMYTIHNPEVSGNIAFLSWYSDGLRVVDIGDPASPREIAAYVPPAISNPRHNAFPDGPLVWGVYLAGDTVLLSDINAGLYVLHVDIQP